MGIDVKWQSNGPFVDIKMTIVSQIWFTGNKIN